MVIGITSVTSVFWSNAGKEQARLPSSYGTNNTTVRTRIESTADPITGTGTYWQYGRINAYEAVAPPDTTPANKMHVASIIMTLRNVGTYTYARAAITIVDAAGKPVAGARLSGYWCGATNDKDTGQTNSSGQVTVQPTL